MPVGVGGGSVGDTISPRLVRTSTPLAGSYAADAPPRYLGIAGFRTVVYYVELVAGPGAPMSAQARVFWLEDETHDPVTEGFSSLRRDAAQNLVVDEPLLPVVPAGTRLRVAIPLANPGGAIGVALSLKDATGGGGDTTIWASSES